MNEEYEINQLAKEDSWRMFRIIGELVEGFDTLADIEPAVTIYGSARLQPDDNIYAETEKIAYLVGKSGYNIMTGGGPGVMEAANKGARAAGVKSIGLNKNCPRSRPATNMPTGRSLSIISSCARSCWLNTPPLLSSCREDWVPSTS